MLGEGERTSEVEEFAYGWGEWDKLPTPSGIDDELIAETLGMTRREEPSDETWHSGKTDDVHGKPG